mgnify:CR=1 FL=1
MAAATAQAAAVASGTVPLASAVPVEPAAAGAAVPPTPAAAPNVSADAAAAAAAPVVAVPVVPVAPPVAPASTPATPADVLVDVGPEQRKIIHDVKEVRVVCVYVYVYTRYARLRSSRIPL